MKRPLGLGLLTCCFCLATNASGQAPRTEDIRIVAEGTGEAGGFGNGIALSGDTLVVGAPELDVKGAVFVFRRNGAGWDQEAKIQEDIDHLRLGDAVDVDGDTLVAGTWHESVWVYVRNGSTWEFQATLTAPDGASDDEFGRTLGLSGDTLVVGASKHGAQGSQAGAAYVFERTEGVWGLVRKLRAPGASAGDLFGYAVAIDGNTIVVGARDDDLAGPQSGGAYVFADTGTGYRLQSVLIGSNVGASDRFGLAVDIDGDRVIVGGPFKSDFWGGAWVFRRTGTQWLEEDFLLRSGNPGCDLFGRSVAIDRDRALIGAPGSDDDDCSWPSRAWVFERCGPEWAEREELNTSDAAPGDNFGWSVALEDGTAIVSRVFYAGLPVDGAVYVFEYEPQELGSAYCTPAVPNSSGAPAVLVITGSTVAADDCLNLRATELPANQTGYFLMGSGQNAVVPTGANGPFCLAGAPFFRILPPALNSGPAGRIEYAPGTEGIPGFGTIVLGETWNFQAWFRDLGGTSNFTDAVSVPFE